MSELEWCKKISEHVLKGKERFRLCPADCKWYFNYKKARGKFHKRSLIRNFSSDVFYHFLCGLGGMIGGVGLIKFVLYTHTL